MNLKNKIETLEKKYRLISDNLRDVIWVVDAQTRQYEYITPSIEKMTGYTPEEYMNATIEKFILPEHTKKILKLLQENKVLNGLLPICSGCKRIRNEDGKWWPLDAYVKEKTSAKLTHTICEDCEAIYYGDLS